MVLSFALGFALASLVVVLLAARLRAKVYAIFAGVLLAVTGLVSVAYLGIVGPLWPLWVYLSVAIHVHFVSLIWARMRPMWWRVLVSGPALTFVAASFFAVPWAIAAALGFNPWVPWLPFALAGVGVLQSVWTRETVVDLSLDADTASPEVDRFTGGAARAERPLRVVQITDPHLGPWMSERRLRRIVERAVAREPDLVVLTGDFLTMESHADPMVLGRALEPLRALPGRVFACRGNHDLEAPEVVREALEHAGVRLLIDEAHTVETDAGPLQIVGVDFRFRGRREAMQALFARVERPAHTRRLVLLHDPGAFRLVPEGEADLVLSGHTHGGQVGLVSLGLRWTPVWSLVKMPDHGLFARGRDRLYVHRGTGHYGFPLRVGVPAEQSLLRVHFT